MFWAPRRNKIVSILLGQSVLVTSMRFRRKFLRILEITLILEFLLKNRSHGCLSLLLFKKVMAYVVNWTQLLHKIKWPHSMEFWWVYGQVKEIILAISWWIFSIEDAVLYFLCSDGFHSKLTVLGSLDIWPIFLFIESLPPGKKLHFIFSFIILICL